MCEAALLCSPLGWVESVIITALVGSIVPVSSGCHTVPQTLQVNESLGEAFLNTKFCPGQSWRQSAYRNARGCGKSRSCLLHQLGLWAEPWQKLGPVSSSAGTCVCNLSQEAASRGLTCDTGHPAVSPLEPAAAGTHEAWGLQPLRSGSGAGSSADKQCELGQGIYLLEAQVFTTAKQN